MTWTRTQAQESHAHTQSNTIDLYATLHTVRKKNEQQQQHCRAISLYRYAHSHSHAYLCEKLSSSFTPETDRVCYGRKQQQPQQ